MSRAFTTITISRQFGSGGREFALDLGKRLGFPVFDRELLTDMAREMKTSEEIVDTYEKLRYGSQRFVLTTLSKRYNFLERELIETKRYVASLRKVVLKLVSLGNVIIVGRGGQCILHGHPSTLHLRIVAELPYRLERLAGLEEYASLTQRQIEKLVRESDRYRASFTRKHYDRRIDDPTLYHLTVNFSLLGPPRALETVEGLVRG